MESEKSNEKANEFRLAGNQHYKARKFYQALVCYNRSLSNAVLGTPDFAIAIANRSAVYMELKEYDLCLENIEFAIEAGYPEDRKKILVDRREKCRDMLQVHEPDPLKNPWMFFKLSYPSHKKIPFVANCVELRKSKKFGRHLITNQALKAGDIINIEEPFHKYISNGTRFSHCGNCLKSEKLNLLPCLRCNYIMFCSKHCMSVADRFHQVECSIINVNPDEEDSLFDKAHQQVFDILSAFDNIKELEKFYEDNPHQKTVFDIDFTNVDKEQRFKNLLQAVNSLQQNEIPKELEPMMKRNIEMMELLTENGQQIKPKEQEIMGRFFRKQVKIMITNVFGINRNDNSLIGGGIFPLGSFFNHSCAQNVVRISVEGKLAFVVVRPIEKNHQLFICYRENFLETGKRERQADIQKTYGFKCSCEACAHDYPIIDYLPSDNTYLNLCFPEITLMEKAMEEFRRNCDYINQNAKKYPSFELCKLIQRNVQLLDYIAEIREIPW